MGRLGSPSPRSRAQEPVRSAAAAGHLARSAAAAATLLAVLSAAACLSLQEGPRGADAPHIAHGSLFRYPWVWTDELGNSVTFARWRGEPLVVAAMFTSCRSTCPRTLKKLRELYAAMSRDGRPPQFLLVTLDPDTDTPEHLREFKQSEQFPDSWHFLRGDAQQTQELEQVFDIHVLAADSHLVHDGRIVVFDDHGLPERSFSGFALDDEAPVL